MLAMTPAFAIGDSDATYASAEEDCAYAPTARAAQETRKEKRILTDELHWKASDGRRLLTRLTTTATERTEASADLDLNLSRIYTSSARRYYARQGKCIGRHAIGNLTSAHVAEVSGGSGGQRRRHDT